MFHIEFQKFVQQENLKQDKMYNAKKSGSYWKSYQQEPLHFKDRSVHPVINSLKNTLRSCVVKIH
jgi:hypothetical protein